MPAIRQDRLGADFDRSQFNHIDQNLRKLVDETYDLCIFKCNEKNASGLKVCKDTCF